MPDDLKELHDLEELCLNERDCFVQYLHCTNLSQGLEKDVNMFLASTKDHLYNLEKQRADAATVCGRRFADANYAATLIEFLDIIRHNASFIEEHVSIEPISIDTQKTVSNILKGVVDTLHKSEDMAVHVNRLKREDKGPQNINYTSELSH